MKDFEIITPQKKTPPKLSPYKIPPSPQSFIEHLQYDNIQLQEKDLIGISGIIGTGKTSLARALGKLLDLPVLYEPEMDKKFLEDFYKNKKRYSFSLQVKLLNERFSQQQKVLWEGKGGITDRTMYEDSLFAKVLFEEGNMEERQYKTYLNLFRNMSHFMKKYTLIVHLDVKPEEALTRIRERNYEYEKDITLDYLTRLYNAYEDFIQHISKAIPVIRVNYLKFKSVEEMARKIKEEYENMTNIKILEYSDSDDENGGN